MAFKAKPSGPINPMALANALAQHVEKAHNAAKAGKPLKRPEPDEEHDDNEGKSGADNMPGDISPADRVAHQKSKPLPKTKRVN
jgi:hypothetical protein